MKMKRWKFVLLAALAGLAAPVAAQNYPTKPVQVILAFTPGSAVDIVGRIVTAKLSEMWGQPVVNDNRAGAGGSIGSAAVARAAGAGRQDWQEEPDIAGRADHRRGGRKRRRIGAVGRHVGTGGHESRARQQDQCRCAQGARRPRREGKAARPRQ